MRIISQNGLLDMPYELIAISPYSGNMATIVGTFPGNALGKGDRVYILAEYSTALMDTHHPAPFWKDIFSLHISIALIAFSSVGMTL